MTKKRTYHITIEGMNFVDESTGESKIYFESASRNAKQHAVNYGGRCTVYTKGGKMLSDYVIDAEGGYYTCQPKWWAEHRYIFAEGKEMEK